MILAMRVRPVASELNDIDRVVLKNWQFLAG